MAGWIDSADEFTASDRLLMFVRSPRFSAFVGVGGERTNDLIAVARDILDAFDLATAEGVQLDRLGAILQLPRYGYADARYRTLLQIQAQLVLSSTTTTPVILRIVELFTGYAPTSYSETYPMGYTVGAQLDDLGDSALLAQILRSATAAAYEVQLVTSAPLDVRGDYSTIPIDELRVTDIGDYSTDPIAGAGTGAYSLSA